MLKPTDLYRITDPEVAETIRALAVELADAFDDLDESMARAGVPWKSVSRDPIAQQWVQWAIENGRSTQAVLVI